MSKVAYVDQSNIRQIIFHSNGTEVVNLLFNTFGNVVGAESVDFKRYIRFSRQRLTMHLLDLMHPFLSHFAEVYVWTRGRQVVGTGAIARTTVSDKTWLLMNFAISSTQARGFGAVISMRSIFRKAIQHAADRGAKCVYAYVRSNNASVLAICQNEGFCEIEERTYYFLNAEHVSIVSKATSVLPMVEIRQYQPLSKQILLGWIASYFIGARRQVFEAYHHKHKLGTIERSMSRSPCRPYELSVTPVSNCSEEQVYWMVSWALASIVHQKHRVTISLPAKYDGCINNCIPDRFDRADKRKLMALEIIRP